MPVCGLAGQVLRHQPKKKMLLWGQEHPLGDRMIGGNIIRQTNCSISRMSRT